MNIIGERVVLRALEEQDNEMLLSLINDPEIECMIGGSSAPISAEEQAAWFAALRERPDVIRCAIADKADPHTAVGTVILTDIDMKNGVAQIHVKLAVRGAGYGTDAVKTMVKYAFEERRLQCVYAAVLAYNNASRRLFEKCGFKQEGVFRNRIFKQGQYVDEYVYSVLKEEF
ncbi:MAG: GNAT family N-acetyltransferase [Clostridia bacterium]|nr:GNAT family N-acetyltransferase [Clostridia bacterium]